MGSTVEISQAVAAELERQAAASNSRVSSLAESLIRQGLGLEPKRSACPPAQAFEELLEDCVQAAEDNRVSFSREREAWRASATFYLDGRGQEEGAWSDLSGIGSSPEEALAGLAAAMDVEPHPWLCPGTPLGEIARECAAAAGSPVVCFRRQYGSPSVSCRIAGTSKEWAGDSYEGAATAALSNVKELSRPGAGF